jgi:hypothetical protein
VNFMPEESFSAFFVFAAFGDVGDVRAYAASSFGFLPESVWHGTACPALGFLRRPARRALRSASSACLRLVGGGSSGRERSSFPASRSTGTP